MLADEKGRTHLSEMPLDRVLPETDGPFAQHRGGPLMPWEASNISNHLELLMGNSKTEVSSMLRANLKHLLDSSSLGNRSQSVNPPYTHKKLGQDNPAPTE